MVCHTFGISIGSKWTLNQWHKRKSTAEPKGFLSSILAYQRIKVVFKGILWFAKVSYDSQKRSRRRKSTEESKIMFPVIVYPPEMSSSKVSYEPYNRWHKRKSTAGSKILILHHYLQPAENVVFKGNLRTVYNRWYKRKSTVRSKMFILHYCLPDVKKVVCRELKKSYRPWKRWHKRKSTA
jgi:hypothetical protein